MRILHFIASVDSATGGPVEGLRQRCAIYHAGGHEVEIASLDSPEFVDRCDLPATLVGLGPGRGTYGYTPNAVPWLKANLSRFDVVFVNGVWNYNTLAAHRSLAGTGIPWAIFTHGMLDPYFKKQYPLKHLKKALYWHTTLAKVFHDANSVLFTCEEEKILARQSFSRYHVREEVVPYGTFGPNCDTAAASEEFLARWPELRGKRLAISRPHSPQERHRHPDRGIRGHARQGPGMAPGHRWPRPDWMAEGTRSVGGETRHRIPHYLDRKPRRRAEVGSVLRVGGVCTPIAPGELRNCGGRSHGLQPARHRVQQGQYLARDYRARCRIRWRRYDGGNNHLASPLVGPDASRDCRVPYPQQDMFRK